MIGSRFLFFGIVFIFSSKLVAGDLWEIEASSEDQTSSRIYSAYDVVLNPVWSTLEQGDEIDVPVESNALTLKVTFIKNTATSNIIVGHFINNANSEFYLKKTGGLLEGHFYLADDSVGYRFSYSGDGTLYSMNIDQIACLGYGVADAGEGVNEVSQVTVDSYIPHNNFSQASSLAAVPSFQSLPGSSYVLYIDFDGETVTAYFADQYNNGNPIVAPPFDLDGDPNSFNAAEQEFIETVWKGVSENYSLFDVNVTTDRAIFDAATDHQRAQNIVTGYCLWYDSNDCNGAEGLAAYPQFGTFKNVSAGYEYEYSPSWAWPFSPSTGVLRRTPEGVAQDVSHEFGHGFWLDHDGRTYTLPSGNIRTIEYYSGNAEWGPIMGYAGNAADKIITFSKGDYATANNQQDDIAQINQAHLSFRFDSNETYSGEGTRSGVIGSLDEDDYTFFAKPTDTISLSVSVVAANLNNLDARLQLYDPDGVLVVDANPTNSYNASITHVPTKQGTYKVRVSGVGSTTANSYTRYGSIGQYTLNIARSQINPDPVPIVMAPIHYLLLDDD